MQVHAGIDIGGTGTRIVVLGRGRAILSESRFNTADLALGSRTARIDRLADAVIAIVPSGAQLLGLGIGASGPVDPVRGTIANPDTLPGFSGFKIVEGMERRLGVPVLIDNDAMVAAIGEQRIGAGKRSKRMLLVCLGTGIGVALVIDGQPFRGSDDAHPEAGHFPITSDGGICYCGIIGCWEHLASRSALQTMLKPLVAGTTSSRDIIRVAAGHIDDARISATFHEFGELVGRGLLSLQALYVPDTIIIGGSAAEQFDLIRPGIFKGVQSAKWFDKLIAIKPTALGDNAGAIGAALTVMECQNLKNY